jgi:flavorubredoxin
VKAIVVYESHWGNTAAIARAIAEGIGPDARAMTTTEATAEVVARAELIVAGAPLLAFGLPSEKIVQGLPTNPASASRPPDVSHPILRTWLESVPKGTGLAAAFETGLRWSPGSSTGTIIKRLQAAGYRVVGKGQRFVIKGSYGPMRDGEIERARAWGAELARAAA